MGSRDLEVDIFQFLQAIQLEQFFDKIHHVLHLTRLSHFDHVNENDLTDINMSKPEQRRLMDALKKHKKDKKKAIRSRFSLRKSKKKEDSTTTLSHNSSGITSPKHGQKSCLITESSLSLQEEIGNGYFGIVRKGTWTTDIGSMLPVAVKSLKFSNCEEFAKEQSDIMREASAMSDFNHPNVIHLYGVVLSSPLQLVMELAPLGSLLDRLNQEPQKFLISKLCDFVYQVASGMSYLESKRYVHRDLAARNLLLASYEKVKIGDFGLMRPLPIDEDIYVMNPNGRVPFAWCAPECLKTRQFSHASDVWAFGITVIEMFSYGKQPWEGLDAAQILELVDEPVCSRLGKPDHCPDEIYSLLIEDCWSHKPSAREKFHRIRQKLNEVLPEDITIISDVEGDKESVKLCAQAGDKITVITWKSRLGRDFAKGQNRRTGQVGYFPIGQSSRSLTKKKSPKTKEKVVKVKDISPPLGNTFSHIAHRGEGGTPNWGPVMSDERQVVGKQVPLNFPTRLIALKDYSKEIGGNLDPNDCDIKSMDSVNCPETSSLSSRGSSTYSGMGSIRSCSDSGYYSNRNTVLSDYETMGGTRPITIPYNQAFPRPISSQSVNTPGPNDRGRCPSVGSLQVRPTGGQRYRTGTVCSEGSPVVSASNEIRPTLPPKQMVGKGRRVSETSRTDLGVERDIIEKLVEEPNTYENSSVNSSDHYENLYENFSTQEFPLDPSLPSSSPNSFYSNETGTFFITNSLYKGNRTLSESGEIYSVPVTSRPVTKNCELCSSKPCACATTKNRCNTFPPASLKNIRMNREGNKGKSVSLLENISSYCDNDSRTSENVTSSVQPCCQETSPADQDLGEEIYENMDHYNVSGNVSDFEINRDTPPPLPTKRRPLQRRQSEQSQLDTQSVYSLPRSDSILENDYQNLRIPGELSKNVQRNSDEFDENIYQSPGNQNSENSYTVDDGCDNIYEEPHLVTAPREEGPWVPRNRSSGSVDAHTYIEISQKLSETLHVDGSQMTDRELGSCDDAVFHGTFREISNDFADLDAICAKLRENNITKSEASRACSVSGQTPPEQKPLAHSQSVCQINLNQRSVKTGGAPWKRFSADQETLNRYAYTKTKSCSAAGQKSSQKNSLSQHHPPDSDNTRTLHTHITLVTTV